jgi:hypothetical protein
VEGGIVDSSSTTYLHNKVTQARRCSGGATAACALQCLQPWLPKMHGNAPRCCSSEHVTSGIGLWRRQSVSGNAPPGRWPRMRDEGGLQRRRTTQPSARPLRAARRRPPPRSSAWFLPARRGLQSMVLPRTTPFGSLEQRRHPASPGDALCARRLRRINWFVHSKDDAQGSLISSSCLLFNPSMLWNCKCLRNLVINQHTI